MGAIEPNWPSLVPFCLLWVACCVAFLVVAEMLPLGRRPEPMRLSGGAALVAVNALVLAALIAGTWLYGWRELRLTSLIVFGGLVVLFAPALFDVWPAAWRDRRAGFAALLALQTVGLALLYGLASGALLPSSS